MGELRVLDAKLGDLKVIWDPDKPAEVKAAREQFDKLLQTKKYWAYSVDKEGAKKRRITEFDPEAGKIILSEHIVGG